MVVFARVLVLTLALAFPALAAPNELTWII